MFNFSQQNKLLGNLNLESNLCSTFAFLFKKLKVYYYYYIILFLYKYAVFKQQQKTI
jgi:hypothetical protein